MNEKNQDRSPLHKFIGEWTMQSPQFPDGRGKVTFEWLEGEAFLLQRSYPLQAAFPASEMIIGWDDTLKTYSVLYHDSRGVFRIYQMSLNGNDWRLWRDAPGFSQRFIATISPDGKMIQARWEKSFDGSQWEHDFDLIYTKVN
jgi:hypothetical protein